MDATEEVNLQTLMLEGIQALLDGANNVRQLVHRHVTQLKELHQKKKGLLYRLRQLQQKKERLFNRYQALPNYQPNQPTSSRLEVQYDGNKWKPHKALPLHYFYLQPLLDSCLYRLCSRRSCARAILAVSRDLQLLSWACAVCKSLPGM